MSTVLDKPTAPKLDIEEMLDRHRVATDHWKPHRERFRKNIRMYTGDQWNPKAKKEREDAGRPCFAVNMLRQPIRQIVNDARQNRIGPKMIPVDGRADKDMAQVFADMLRGLDYQSRAHIADEYALEMAAAGGFGFIRVTWAYAYPGSLDKMLIVERVPDPERVALDPFAIEPDASDQEYAFIDHFFSKKYIKRRWKRDDVDATMDSDDPANDWQRENGGKVVEYWQKVYGKDYTVYRFSDGTEVKDREQMEAYRDMIIGEAPIDDRKTQDCAIWQYFTDGKDALEDPAEWPDSRYIPIIPVWGNEIWVEGKRMLDSVIQDSHGPQEYLNYMVVKAAEMAGQAPLAPHLVPDEGVDPANFPEWKTANSAPHQYLRYRQYDDEGRQLNAPTREQYEPAIQGYSLLTEQAKSFLDSTHGVQRVARGETDPTVKSAKHSLSLQRESDMSSFHIHDNLARAVQHRYRIMTRVAPKLIDVKKWIRIIGEDNAEQAVQVFQATRGDGMDYEGPAMQFQKKTDKGMVDAIAPLDPEMYDVRVDTGPSLTTRRQEAAMQTLELAKIIPLVAEAAPHKIIRNLDIPGADEIADQVEKALPPGLREPKDGEQQIDPETQQKIQQMEQLIETAKAEIDQLKMEKQAKVIETQGRGEIESQKIAADKEVNLRKADFEIEKLRLEKEKLQLEWEIAKLNAKVKMEAADMQHEHDEAMAVHNARHASHENEQNRQVQRESAQESK